MFPIDVYGQNKAIKMIEYMHQSNPRGNKTVITKPTLIRKGLLLVWSKSMVSIAMVGQEERAGRSITRLMDWLLIQFNKPPNIAFTDAKRKPSTLTKQALPWHISVDSQSPQDILTSTRTHSAVEKKIFV